MWGGASDDAHATPLARGESQAFVARLHVTWGGTPVDSVSLRPGRKARLRLRTGTWLEVRPCPVGDGLDVRLDEGPWQELPVGKRRQAPGGHALALEIDRRAAAPAVPWGVDSHLFHAATVAVAVQACLVAALYLAPTPAKALLGGGGLQKPNLQRLLRVTAGTASERGKPAFALAGRRPDEAERVVEPRVAAGAPTRSLGERAHKPTLADTLDAIAEALNHGAPGVNLGRTVGDLAQSTARSEQLEAGMGGLIAPRRLFDAGSGSGPIDVGTSRLTDPQQRRDPPRDPLPSLEELRLARAPLLIGPASPADVPNGEVRLDGIDPVVRDHISRAVRERKKSIRYCYESWGLASNPRRQGRLMLEMTLLPDGHLTAIEARAADRSLALVANCVEQQVSEWYLGSGLVSAPRRLSFPFLLQPGERR